MRDSFNAVFIEADAVGELMLYGRGAGGEPTASAVLGDLVDAAKNLVERRAGRDRSARSSRKPIRPIDEVETPVLPAASRCADQPGRARRDRRAVRRATACRSSRCSSAASGDDARLIFITHRAREADLRATLDALRDVDVVHRVGSVLRVVGDDE